MSNGGVEWVRDKGREGYRGEIFMLSWAIGDNKTKVLEKYLLIVSIKKRAAQRKDEVERGKGSRGGMSQRDCIAQYAEILILVCIM